METQIITLKTGEKVTVDADDFLKLAAHRWHRTCKGYAATSLIPGQTIFMHRVINQTPDGMETDHINGDKLDNRKANLRSCTCAENARSRTRKPGATGFTGVTMKHEGRGGPRFYATVMKDYRRVSLGGYPTAELAAQAYDRAAQELHGEFAKQNFRIERR